MTGQPTYDAIVLAGGRATRAGGDKLQFQRAGRDLLGYACAAVASADTIVVAGPTPETSLPAQAVFVPDQTQYGGPLAAVATALERVRAEVVVVLAGDLPDAAPAVPELLAALTATPTATAAVLVDAAGFRQPLLAAYRTAALRARLQQLAGGGDLVDAPARWLLGEQVYEVADRWAAAHDLDTPADAAELGFTPPVP